MFDITDVPPTSASEVKFADFPSSVASILILLKLDLGVTMLFGEITLEAVRAIASSTP